MSRPRATLRLAVLCLLVVLPSTVAGQEDDPFADEPPLFEDGEDDPFTELEERTTLDGDADAEDEDDTGDEEEQASSEDQADRIPASLWLAIASLSIAALAVPDRAR